MEQNKELAGPAGGSAGVITVCVRARVTYAAELMCDSHVGCLVVVDDEQNMVGIVSERDILGWISNASPSTFGASVADIMTPDVVTCAPETPMEEAERLMVEHGLRHVPVVSDGKPVGMISSRDLMKHQLEAGR